MYSTAGQLGIEGVVIIPKGQKGEEGHLLAGGLSRDWLKVGRVTLGTMTTYTTAPAPLTPSSLGRGFRGH